MILTKLTEEFASSLKYIKDYQLFSTHEGSRYSLLSGLNRLIKAYQPLIKKVNAKGYIQYYDYNLSKHWELAIDFISENFSEKVLKDFQELPKYENKLKYNNLAANVFDIGFQISREEKNKNKDTTVQQYNYLKYMVNCLDYYLLQMSYIFSKKSIKQRLI